MFGAVCVCVCAHLRPNESLEAGLEVVDAAVVELGHLVQQLLVLGFKVVPDRPQLIFSLVAGEEGGGQRSDVKPHPPPPPPPPQQKLSYAPCSFTTMRMKRFFFLFLKQ